MYDLTGKRALVCGASQGIGRACAVELAKCGAEVTLVARSEEHLRRVLSELSIAAHQTHRYLVADFAEPTNVQAKVVAHLAATGPHSILVNNTGGPPSGPITEATPEAFVAAFTHHVLCYQLLAKAVVPGMREVGYGRIINIVSTSVVAPMAGLGVSNTTRAAVANWARTWAGELAPFGITVNNVLPGYTATDRLWSLFEKRAQRQGKSAEAVKAETIASIPMRRLAKPEEIGSVVAFLASPAASYVTGVNLPVDGGRTAVQG